MALMSAVNRGPETRYWGVGRNPNMPPLNAAQVAQRDMPYVTNPQAAVPAAATGSLAQQRADMVRRALSQSGGANARSALDAYFGPNGGAQAGELATMQPFLDRIRLGPYESSMASQPGQSPIAPRPSIESVFPLGVGGSPMPIRLDYGPRKREFMRGLISRRARRRA